MMNIPNTHINRDYILDFLENGRLGTLSTVTPDGKPDAASVYYVVDNNFDILFLTKDNTTKYKNIQHQNEVVFIVTNIVKKETAKIRGKTFPMEENANLVVRITDQLAEALHPEKRSEMVLPVLKLSGGQLTAVKIKPYQIHLSIYREQGVEQETIYLN